MAGSLLTRPVLVPVCRVVMDMDKDMAREEVLHAGRAPAATAGGATCDIEEVQGRDGAEVADVGLNLQLIPLPNLRFLPGHCALSPSLLVISRGGIGSPFA